MLIEPLTIFVVCRDDGVEGLDEPEFASTERSKVDAYVEERRYQANEFRIIQMIVDARP